MMVIEEMLMVMVMVFDDDVVQQNAVPDSLTLN